MSDSIISTPKPARLNRSLRRRIALICVISGLLLIIIPTTLKTWRLVQLGRAFQQHQTNAEALLAAGPSNLDPDQTAALVEDVRADYLDLKAEVSPMLPLTPYLTWVPKVGPLMPAAPQLLEMGDKGTLMAVQLMTGLQPTLEILQDNRLEDQRLPALIQVLDEAQPYIAQAADSFDELVEVRQTLGDTSQFPDTAQQLLALMDEQTPIVKDGLQMAQVLPAIMGQEGTRTYLIVAQNEDEIRPTGGFISGVGLMVVDQGNLVSLDFTDAYRVDNTQNLAAYNWPPQPLYEFMQSDYFLFRDSNFWPNFPTSAQSMIALYELGQNKTVDGVIAIDQKFLELLIIALEPVQIPELDMTLTSANIRENLQTAWETGSADALWVSSRKAFMGPMANAILQKVLQDTANINPLLLARALQTGIDGRHVQFYMVDPQIQKTLTAVGWDGRLAPMPNQDNLLIVDSNLGFNKVNAIIEKNTTYKVQLALDAPSQANLLINYQNPSNGTTDCADIVTQYEIDTSLPYEELINTCYRNYVRVYTTPNSQLIQASEHPVSAANLLRENNWPGQAQTIQETPEWTTFANYFLLPHQQTTAVNFVYQVPSSIIQTADGQYLYNLTVYKQAGSKAEPLTIEVELPPNTVFVEASSQPVSVNGQTITFNHTLDQDVSLTVIFR